MKRILNAALSIFVSAGIGLSGLISAHAQPLIQGFEAGSTGYNFPDSTIAAGPSSLVVMVNSQITVYNKQGGKLFQQTLGGSTGFWKAQHASTTVAEPWAIFDPNSGRFIVSAADFGVAKGVLYFAISKNSAPATADDWYKYKIDRTGAHQNPAFPNVATYPDDAKVGVDADAIYVTSAHFAKDQNVTGLFSHAELFAIAKTPLLSGGPLTIVHDEPVITDSYTQWLVFKIQPAIVFGAGQPMYFVQSLVTRPDDKLVVHTLSNVLTAPSRSVSFVPVAPYDRPPDVPQLGSSALLEGLNARLMSAVVRNGSLWTTHAVRDPAVDAESLVRWYEIDLATTPGTPLLAQSGNVDPGPGIHAWLPSISVDSQGNMGLGFSISGVNMYAGIAYTGQRATDPLGSTLPIQLARAGEGPFNQYAWGEYAGLAIDPDGLTFWQFNQYASAANSWKTYVSAFQVAEPPAPANPLHSGDLDGSATATSKNWKATVVVTVHDGNEAPAAGANVSIQWSGAATGTATLTTDASGHCTFVSGNLSKTSPSATLTITGMTHPTLTYSAAANHDSNGNSNGTAILVNRP